MKENPTKKILTCKICGFTIETACREYRCPFCDTHITPCSCCRDEIDRRVEWRSGERLAFTKSA